MKKSYSFYLVIAALMATAILLYGIKHPSTLYSPGDVVTKHSRLGCNDCHAAFRRPPASSCSASNCHEPGKVGKKAAITDLHKKLEGQDCLSCHTEHKGATGKITIAFDHRELLKTQGCADCHKGPKDELHISAGRNCRSCHTTKAWKPSTYDHIKFFPLEKEHKVACNKCHDTSSYKNYTCMNCHAHATRGIIEEHREEGVRNYGDCLRCHRVYMKGRSYGTGKVDDSMIDDDDDNYRRDGRYRRDNDDD